MSSTSRHLERYGIQPEITYDQAALLGHVDGKSTTGQQAGQHRIHAHDQGMLSTLGEMFAAARRPIEERIARLIARLAPLEDQITGAQQDLDKAVESRDDAKAKVRVLGDRRGKLFLEQRKLPLWGYLPLMAAFVIAELILNSTALQIIGESNLAVLLLAGALVIAMLVICHYIGDALREAEEYTGRRKKLGRLFALAVLILLFLWAIGGVRVAFLTRIGITSDLLGVYILQLPVIAAAIIIAYLYANTHARGLARRERDVWSARRRLAALQRQRAALQGEVNAAETNREHLAQLYLERANVAQGHSRGLLAEYRSVYTQTKGEPPELLALEPAPWMRGWIHWLSQRADPTRPPRDIAQLTVVPPPEDAHADDGEEREAR